MSMDFCRLRFHRQKHPNFQMKPSRRNFLGSSAILLGREILNALATPLWKWTRPLVLRAASLPGLEEASPVTYVNVAAKAGLNVTNV
jgi:hypothetical protein